ncbi:hypothetical protein [Streptomyces sp. 3213.3]|uniref:hypothetical protein n=1 Tax=Streptomyces sp. 3213.3 TaxID=1855348 RepID=UPI001F3ACBF8|nr:hypothetical protein [Streptomyces sp. 3213.3]
MTLAVCTALALLSGCGSGDGTAAREPSASSDGGPSTAAADVTTADPDGDGFPDFVTSVQGSMVLDGNVVAPRTVPYVTWGGATAKASAAPVQLRQNENKLGLRSLVRGGLRRRRTARYGRGRRRQP